MEASRKKNDLTVKQAAVIVVMGLVGLYFTGYYDPLPEQSSTESDGIFVYYGPEGETIPNQGVDPEHVKVAEAALSSSDYYGAFAVGPRGRTGVWTGAYSIELANSYAVAACGTDCVVVAERLPLHRDPSRSEPVLTTAIARNLAVKWPFTDDYIALGGAGSWGHRAKPAGKSAWKSAMRKAAADCEARRADETAPIPDLSKACAVQRISDIEDLRPKPTIYPAAYSVQVTSLAPVTDPQIVEIEGAPTGGLFGPYLPPDMYGARAANGASAFEVVRRAGWPEAGKTAALAKCNAERRPGEPECMISHVRMPSSPVSQDSLAVTSELFEAYTAWQATMGAGAFAIGPYGAWGTSYNLEDVETAKQKAADWCWHHTRKSWEFRQIDRAFLDPGLSCRIVAIREP